MPGTSRWRSGWEERKVCSMWTVLSSKLPVPLQSGVEGGERGGGRRDGRREGGKRIHSHYPSPSSLGQSPILTQLLREQLVLRLHSGPE